MRHLPLLKHLSRSVDSVRKIVENFIPSLATLFFSSLLKGGQLHKV